MRRYLIALALVLSASAAQAQMFEGGMGGGAPWLQRAMRDVGRNPTGWSRQWCGRQMSMWVGGGGNTAISFAHYGSPTSARPGAIAVMPHHVCIVTAVSGGSFSCVGGNHSGRSGHRVVGVGRYSMRRAVAFRWPR